ncbi:hypothetical protein Hypma_015680 [Hypsizygus marmoreus]|uniref:Uncharacterized protein n=1 Tax=Hypsizygus marmoreus TaxID=39966 RepID=A0A369K3A9_HYPMA|nr:hypothetical protein Hypma_015680 [Hypsizygus marmoreus]
MTDSSSSKSPGDIRSLFGLPPHSENLTRYLTFLANLVSTPVPPTPEVKAYSDAVYLNYYPLGLSLLFSPHSGYKPKSGLKFGDLNKEKLALDSIDIYNIPMHSSSDPRSKGTSSRIAELAFSTFPLSPLVLDVAKGVTDKDNKVLVRPSQLELKPGATGREIVQCLGEPERKGGGAGPSSGSIGIWCEWSKDGIMVEFGGDEAKGPQAWERGKDAVWKVITLFPPKSQG